MTVQKISPCALQGKADVNQIKVHTASVLLVLNSNILAQCDFVRKTCVFYLKN